MVVGRTGTHESSQRYYQPPLVHRYPGFPHLLTTWNMVSIDLVGPLVVTAVAVVRRPQSSGGVLVLLLRSW